MKTGSMICPFRISANGFIVEFPAIIGWTMTEVIGISIINPHAVSKVSKSSVI